MFGGYRLLLAALVVFQHFSPFKVGGLAVVAFFVLSGFLMTLLMDGPYQGRIGAFALNRFLRLYPAYWATLLLMAALILIGLPISRRDIGIPDFGNLALDAAYFAMWDDNPQLVLTAWAVTNELAYYALIAFGISKTRNRSLLWLAASVLIYLALPIWMGNSERYFSVLSASLPFALGATAYHFRNAWRSINPSYLLFIAGGTAAASATIHMLGLGRGDAPHLVFLIAVAGVALALFRIRPLMPRWALHADEWAGRLSYPTYLNHYAAAMIVMAVFPFPLGAMWTPLVPTLWVGSTVFLVSAALSVVTYLVVDRPIEGLRTQLRQGRISPQPSAAAPVSS